VQGPGSIELSRLAVEVSRRAMRSARQRVNFVLRPALAALRRGSAWAGRGHMMGHISDHALAAFPRRQRPALPEQGRIPGDRLSQRRRGTPIMGRMRLVLAANRARGPRATRVALRFAGLSRSAAGASCHRAALSSCLKGNGLSLIPLAAAVRASFACRHVGLGQGPELERSRWT
jgi:hypothetical protein